MFGVGGLSDPDAVWGSMSNQLLGPGLVGLMLAGVLAGTMSTLAAKALAISSLLVCAHPSAAQRPPQTSMTLRGVVVGAETSEPLGFSIVTLIPNVGRQFTDHRGVFTFSEVRNPKTGAPRYSHFIVAPGKDALIRGWHKRNEAPNNFLSFLVTAYGESECWAREVLEERAAPGWPRDLTLVLAAAFDAYQRGAIDYEP